MNRIADYLNNKSILLLGFGREGQSSYHFIRKYLKNNPICIADKNIHLDKSSFADEHLNFVLGDNYLDNINDFKNLSSEELKKGIKFLTNLKYTNYNQITRTIRMTRYQIDKYLKRGGKREKF